MLVPTDNHILVKQYNYKNKNKDLKKMKKNCAT